MKDNLLKLIRSRRTIRKYTDKEISNKQIMKILEAGRWSPSVHNAQPWRFIVIRKEPVIKRLAGILLKKSHHLFSGFDIIVKKTAEVVLSAPIAIVIYNSCELSKRMRKFGDPYFSITEISELQSISASIENMLLMAHSLGLGAAWLTSPLFCAAEIRSLFNINGSFVALLTIGYSGQSCAISDRKSLKSCIKFY